MIVVNPNVCRRCVPDFQKKMDAAAGEEQVALKKKLLNSLERYFYLVCFGAYCRAEGNPGHQKGVITRIVLSCRTDQLSEEFYLLARGEKLP